MNELVIIFNSERAREYLLEYGHVYTFRLKRRSMIGNDWMTDKYRGRKIRDIHITEKGHYAFKDLRLYVSQSGFKTLKSWIDEAVVLNWRPGGSVINEDTRGWVYLVTLR